MSPVVTIIKEFHKHLSYQFYVKTEIKVTSNRTQHLCNFNCQIDLNVTSTGNTITTTKFRLWFKILNLSFVENYVN